VNIDFKYTDGGNMARISVIDTSIPPNGGFGTKMSFNLLNGANFAEYMNLDYLGLTVPGAVFAGSFNTAGVIRTTNTTVSANSTTGALIVAGGAGVSGNVNVGGNVNFTGNLFQNGVLFTSGSSGPNLTLAGNLVVNGTTQSTSKTTGAVIVAGGVGVGGNVEVGGNIDIASNIASTSSITGALTVAGGVGVSGNVNVGGKITSGTSASNTLEAGNLFVGLALTNNTGNFNTGRSVCIDFNNSIGAMNRIRSVDIGISTFQTGFEFYCKQDINFYKSMQIYSTATGGESASNNCDVKIFGTLQAISFNATSDYRIKHNVHSLCDDASFNVDVLKPVSYLNTQLGKPDIGFIAHEVQEHYPYLVNGEKDGKEMQTLNYTGIIGILTKEIQELKKKVSYQETKTIEQEQQIQDLKKMVLDILANK
jgi:hypothetical protein